MNLGLDVRETMLMPVGVLMDLRELHLRALPGYKPGTR